jgi:endonuclease V-like protein UPF0215 family
LGRRKRLTGVLVRRFNYMKGYDFRIAACDGDSVTKTFFAA